MRATYGGLDQKGGEGHAVTAEAVSLEVDVDADALNQAEYQEEPG